VRKFKSRRACVFPLLVFLAFNACGSSSTPKPTPSHFATPPALNGDNCLAGDWVLTSETSTLPLPSGPVPVSGLKGAKLHISSVGLATLNYDTSTPATGTDGQIHVSEVLRGTINYRLQAQSGSLSVTASASDLTLNLTDGTKTTTSSPKLPAPQTLTYTCTATTMNWSSSAVTDAFSRAK
jgi:hypothetical protein